MVQVKKRCRRDITSAFQALDARRGHQGVEESDSMGEEAVAVSGSGG